jgi:hypothetical protein
VRVALAAIAVAVGLAGCGGDDTQTTAAGLVSANAAAFVEVDSDLSSDQWQQLDELLQKFPGRADLLREIREGLADEDLDWERDVEPALGSTTAVAWLDFENDGENFVAITQPEDPEKLRQLLAKLGDDEAVVREVEDWTVVAENDVLIQRLADTEATLAEQERYTEALEGLPDDRLATVYVDGTKLAEAVRDVLSGAGAGALGFSGFDQVESLAAAVSAEEEGVSATFVGRGTESADAQGLAKPYDSKFLDDVPGDALLFLSFNGQDYRDQIQQLQPAQRDALRMFEQLAGISVEQLLSLLGGEGAFYVRPGSLVPEATLLLEADDEQQAVATVDRLARRASGIFGGAPRSQNVDGVDVKTLQLGPVGLNYGAFDDKLVVSLSTAAFRELKSGGEKLGDAEDFKAAAEAAGLPDETSGFFYLNVQDFIPTLETVLNFAGADRADVPPELLENLRPLTSIVAYAVRDGGEARYVVFAHIQ